MAPQNMKQWLVTSKDKGFDGLSFSEAPMPKVGENEVLVKFHAASLNFRDLVIPKVRHWLLNLVPLSLTKHTAGKIPLPYQVPRRPCFRRRR